MITRRKKTPVRDVPHTRLQSDAELTKLYMFEGKLGKGNYGIVYRATHIKTKTEWAIKEMCKPEPGHPRWKLLDNEIEILQKVDHPSIIHLREVLHTAQKMYLAFELCSGGDLKQLLKRKTFFTEDEAWPIIRLLAEALVYLHRRGIVHRDLKLENILLKNPVEDRNDAPVVIKVADFGLAVQSDGSLAGIGTLMTQVCGTQTYMAPEVMGGRGYSHSCDMWSVGVIMYMLLCGCIPFNAKSKTGHLEKIKEGVKFPQPVWAHVSDTAKTVLTCLLSPDPSCRMTAYQLLENPWITGDFSRPVRSLDILELMSQWRQDHAEGSISTDSSPQADTPLTGSPCYSQNKLENGLSQNMTGHNCETQETPQSSSKSTVDGLKPLQPKRKHSTPRKKRNTGQKCTPGGSVGEKSHSRRK